MSETTSACLKAGDKGSHYNQGLATTKQLYWIPTEKVADQVTPLRNLLV